MVARSLIRLLAVFISSLLLAEMTRPAAARTASANDRVAEETPPPAKLEMPPLPGAVSFENGRLPKPKPVGGVAPYETKTYGIHGIAVPPGLSFVQQPDHPAFVKAATELLQRGGLDDTERWAFNFKRVAGRAPRSFVLPVKITTFVEDARGRRAGRTSRVRLEFGEAGAAALERAIAPVRRSLAERDAASQAEEDRERREREQRALEAFEKRAAEKRAREEREAAREARRRREQQADEVAVAIAVPEGDVLRRMWAAVLFYGWPLIVGSVLFVRGVDRFLQTPRPSREAVLKDIFHWSSFAVAAAIALFVCIVPYLRVAGCLTAVAVFGTESVSVVRTTGFAVAGLALFALIAIALAAFSEKRLWWRLLLQAAVVWSTLVGTVVLLNWLVGRAVLQ